MRWFKFFAATASVAYLGIAAAGGAAAQEACSSAPIGDTPFDCLCAGGIPTETVWGSNPYTADSGICAAAFHAGAIGEAGGLVSVIPTPGQASYQGSIGNGIQSRDWGTYGRSFEIVTFAYDAIGPMECEAYPADQPSYTCTCPPYDDTGSVWGSGPYTADSDICAAAIHAGAIFPDGGVVYVLRTEGLPSYRGSDFNGITTRDWGSYSTSFTFDYN